MLLVEMQLTGSPTRQHFSKNGRRKGSYLYQSVTVRGHNRSNKQIRVGQLGKRQSTTQSYYIRQDLRRICRQLKEGGVDVDTRKKLEIEQADLCKSIKRAETQSVNVVPPNFPTLLEEELIKKRAVDA